MYQTPTLKGKLHNAGQLYNKPVPRPSHNGATPESGIKPGSSRSRLVPRTSDPLSLHQDEPVTTETPQQRRTAEGQQRRGNAGTSTNNDIFKLASVQYLELSHTAKAFEECDPTYRPKYSGYYRSSSSLAEEATQKEQEESLVTLLTNYIKPAYKKQEGDKECTRFPRKQYHKIMKILHFIPMTGHRKPVKALHHPQLYGHSRQGGCGVGQVISMGSEAPTTPKWLNSP